VKDNYAFTHDIVLVGGGHSHVEVIRQFAMRPETGVRLTLISRDSHTPYSGMLPGLLAGHYSFEEAHIDLHRLCRATGIRFIHSPVTGVDLQQRQLTLSDRPPIRFDAVCFDTGSSPPTSGFAGSASGSIAVKPVDVFQRRWSQFEDSVRGKANANVCIVGAGAGGVELALSIQHRLQTSKTHDSKFSFTICTSGNEILLSHQPAVRRQFRKILSEREIKVVTDTRIVSIDEGDCLSADGTRLSADVAILVTGAKAAEWYASSGLTLDRKGFVQVTDTLQSVSHDYVFASGDCASMLSHDLPKAGVYAVRQGPLLADNLRAWVRGSKLKSYNPQAHILALISTGDDYAVASRGPLCVAGHWVWRWKDHIDRRWMQRYQQFEMDAPAPGSKSEADASEQMRCGGCGAKVPANILRDVLARIADSNPAGEGVSLGVTDADDAAVIDVPADQLLVQSVDHFRSFIDDPYRFAAITTNHCLNDLFAMGAKPTSALATAIVPYGDPGPVGADLEALLRGALKSLTEAGATLVGGHSAEGAELSFGLTVNGLASPNTILKKGGCKNGDVLVLCKALGTGIILAADMRARADATVVEEALQCMELSNARASEIFVAHEARACTDITGFGLYGHALEMIRASGIGARIDLSAVPLLRGVAELMQAGFASTLAPSNRAQVPELRFGAIKVLSNSDILFDPQTAGGLLAAIPNTRLDACVSDLKNAGYMDAVAIGQITDSLSDVEIRD